MIVRCKDGCYYQNPRWGSHLTIIHATEVVDMWHKSKRPVGYPTLFKAAKALGLCIGLKIKHTAGKSIKQQPVDGDMTKMVFAKAGAAGKFVDAFHLVVQINNAPPVPESYDAKLSSRPADGDDEILDDFSIKAIKARNESTLG